MTMQDAGRERHHPLQDLELFTDCGADALDRLEGMLQVVTVPAGTVVVRAGAVGRHACLVLDGQVAVERDGDEVARLGPGELFGELGMMTGRVRNATVTATTAVRMLVADRSTFDCILEEFPTAASRVFSTARRRTMHAVEGATELELAMQAHPAGRDLRDGAA